MIALQKKIWGEKFPKSKNNDIILKIGITNYNSIQVALVKVHKRLTIGPNYTPHIVQNIGNIYNFILLLRLMVFLLRSIVVFIYIYYYIFMKWEMQQFNFCTIKKMRIYVIFFFYFLLQGVRIIEYNSIHTLREVNGKK